MLPDDIKSLNLFFRHRPEQLAADCPGYKEVSDHPSQTSDLYNISDHIGDFGDLADTDIPPDLSAGRQHSLGSRT